MKFEVDDQVITYNRPTDFEGAGVNDQLARFRCT